VSDKKIETRTAVIDKVEDANQWGFYTVIADDKKYATKNKDLARAAAHLKGKSVELAFTVSEKSKDGKVFKNFYLEGVTEAAQPSFDTAPAAAQSGAPATNRDDSIIRQTVVKAVGAAAAGGNWTIPTALEWCDALYAWVTNAAAPVASGFSDGNSLDDDIPF
jgi:hypothetical protein